jgi:hypothetical protein
MECVRFAKDEVMFEAATKTDQKFIAGEKIETTPTTLLRYQAGFITHQLSAQRVSSICESRHQDLYQ